MKIRPLQLMEFEARYEITFMIECVKLGIRVFNEITLEDKQGREGAGDFLKTAEQMLRFWEFKLDEYDKINKEAKNGTAD